MSLLRVVVLLATGTATAAATTLGALGALHHDLAPTTPFNACVGIAICGALIIAASIVHDTIVAAREELARQLDELRLASETADPEDLITTGPTRRPHYLRSVE